MRKFGSIIWYAIKRRWITLLLASFVVLLWGCDVATHGNLLTGIFTESSFVRGWNVNYNAYAGIATILVALAVWVGELREDWLNDLQKKINMPYM